MPPKPSNNSNAKNLLGSTTLEKVDSLPNIPLNSAGVVGDNTSAESLKRLKANFAGVRTEVVRQYLMKASSDLSAGRTERAQDWALKALSLDEKSGISWHLLAVCRESLGDFASSMDCYQAALALMPEDSDIVNNLGRLATRMSKHDIAEQFFRIYIERLPDRPEGYSNLGSALRSQSQYDEAVHVLKAGIEKFPESALLWNSLGSVMADSGDIERAFIFFEECVRLDPKLSKARYNRSNMRLAMGDPDGALQDCNRALRETKALDEICMMRLARAGMLLNLGKIKEGWEDYEMRLDINFADCTIFSVGNVPKWKPKTDVSGKHILVICEQGLGDEILHSTLIPDMLERIGPEGKLTLAVEYRLVDLLQRSFPAVTVGAHRTHKISGHDVRVLPFLNDDFTGIDLWTPIASLFLEYRTSVESFPNTVGYLKPDPDRVAYWSNWLAGVSDRPKVGLLWKSAVAGQGRHRFFSSFGGWEPVLKAPGVTYINLQYGDCEEELALAREEFGVDIIQPPGIDLKQDLDDVAALAKALDLIIGYSNASFNIGAAAGVPSWLILPPAPWTALGTDRYPWYPQVRAFKAEEFNNWAPIMEEIAADLTAYAASGGD